MSGNEGVRADRDGRVDWRTVQNIPGITYRKFDHWCRKGYIQSARENEFAADDSGNWRTITEDELHTLTLMAELVTLGLTPATAAPLARTLALGITTTFGGFQIRRTE